MSSEKSDPAGLTKTILVVDDSASIRMAIGDALKEAGYIVLEAYDGRHAIGKLDGSKIHLVICDVHMPNMDGLNFIKEMRKLPDYRFTPVIVLTTESGDAKKLRGQLVGVKAWIAKPCSPAQVLTAVSKLVS